MTKHVLPVCFRTNTQRKGKFFSDKNIFTIHSKNKNLVSNPAQPKNSLIPPLENFREKKVSEIFLMADVFCNVQTIKIHTDLSIYILISAHANINLY